MAPMAPAQKDQSDSQATLSDFPRAAGRDKGYASPPLVRSRPYRLNLQRGVTTKAKGLVLEAESSEVQSSAKKSLAFGDNGKKSPTLQKKKGGLSASLEEPGKAKSWYEQTLEEEGDARMFEDVNQQDLLKTLNVKSGGKPTEEDDIPLNEETKNKDSQSFRELMEEDADFEYDEANLQINVVLDEDWIEDEEFAEEDKGEEEEDWDFENDDLLDETVVPETDPGVFPMDEDVVGSDPSLPHQGQLLSDGLEILADLTSGGLPPRGPHLRYSPAQKKKYPIVGVSSRKLNALPARKSPKKSPRTRIVGVPSAGPPSAGPSAQRPATVIAKESASGPGQPNFPQFEESPKLLKKSTRPPHGPSTSTKSDKKKQ